jgi:rod shape-determining protein MreC
MLHHQERFSGTIAKETMLRFVYQYRFYISLLTLILIPILTIDSTGRAPQNFQLIDHIVVGISAPIQSVLSWVLDSSFRACQRYLFLLGTYEANEKLTRKNQELVNEIKELRETSQENQRLRALLHFQEALHVKTIAARVIAKDFLSDFRLIRIRHENNSGIQRNMAVINQKGVIGRILKTSSVSSDVVTIMDMLSAVDVIVERSRVHGILEGLTEQMCELKYVVRTDDIVQGDNLITSGLGGIFPKGLQVGTVTEVNRKPFGMSQQVQVTPSVDFDQLEEVLVLLVAAEELS